MSRHGRDDGHVIIRKPRNRFFPHGGNSRSERHWNDPTNPLNTRRFHGTDPLKDGHDPDENPLKDKVKEDKPSNIPI